MVKNYIECNKNSNLRGDLKYGSILCELFTRENVARCRATLCLTPPSLLHSLLPFRFIDINYGFL